MIRLREADATPWNRTSDCSTSPPICAAPACSRAAAAARFPGAPGGPRGQGCGPHRPADQQGHRAAPAGALAVPGRRPEDKRRAFLFSNVIDGKAAATTCRWWSARSPLRRDLRGRHGEDGGGDRRRLDAGDRESDSAGRGFLAGVPGGGRDRRRPAQPGGGLARLPVPVSTPASIPRPSDGDAVRHPRSDSGVQNIGTYRAALKASDRLVVRWWRAGDGRRRLSALAQISQAARADADRDRDRLRAGGDVHRAAEARRRHGRAGRGRRVAGTPIEIAKAVTIDIDVPASSEIVIEGLIDPDKLEPEAPFGESNGYVALEAFNMPMPLTAITHSARRSSPRSSARSRRASQRDQEGGLRAVVPQPSARRDAIKGVRRVVVISG